VPEYLLYNSQMIPKEEFKLTYDNRGFQYNDGFFDTLIYTKGRVRFLFDHLLRMRQALDVLGINRPFLICSGKRFGFAVSKLIRECDIPAEVVRIKVNIWRKPGGLFTPEYDEADILISVKPQNIIPPIIQQVGFYEELPNRFTPFSFFKGPYALHYVQASLAKKRAGLDEIILLDEQGNISECLVSNIFWIKNNRLFTPALETGCIAGIMRLNIFRAAQMLRLDVQEGFFKQTDLLAADFIFTSNVTGLRPIISINGQKFATEHALLNQLENLVLAG